MQFKGQSAIEYLTTYGWMILVVAVVGGAIFTTIQNQGNTQIDTNLNNDEIKVDETGLTQDSLKLNIRSTAQDNVEIKEIKLKDSETGLKSNISPKSILNFAETSSNTIEDVEPSNSSETYNLKVTYDTGGLEGLKAEGEITANIKLTNRISITQTKFNRTENELKLQLKNTGQNTSSQIDYAIEGNNTFTGTNTQTLNSGEKTWINISLTKTYPLKNTKLKPDGAYFETTEEQLKCAPTEDLIGYWSLNDDQTIETENQTEDLSGLENNGSIRNDTFTGVQGKVGEAYEFDGKDDYISLNNATSHSQYSIAAWFKTNNNSKWGYIYGDHNENRNATFLATQGTEYGSGNGKGLRFAAHIGGENVMLDTSEDVQQNNWHHGVGTYNGSKVKIFVDGVQKNSTEASGSQPEYPRYIGSEAGKYNHFDGKLDEVMIYNRSLSKPEIQRLYNIRNEKWAVNGCKLAEE